MISLLIKNILLDDMVWCYFCKAGESIGFCLFTYRIYRIYLGKCSDIESVSFHQFVDFTKYLLFIF